MTVRVLFFGYLVVIIGGILCFITIGLLHR